MIKRVPEHVAIVLDDRLGGQGAEASPAALAVLSARPLFAAVKTAGVRYLTLCAQTQAQAAAPADSAFLCELEAKARSICDEIAPALNLKIASDTGRPDIVRAVKALAAQVKDGRLRPEDVGMDLLRKTLSTSAFPDPDLVVLCRCAAKASPSPPRPLSLPLSRRNEEPTLHPLAHPLLGCLLFESAYAEFHFAEVPWSDFAADPGYFHRAISDYGLRERRFGRLPEQVLPEKAYPSSRYAGSAAPAALDRF